MSNEDESYSISAGVYWDPFSEMFPFAEEIVSILVNTGRLQGKTIINLISSQYSGIKTLELDNKNGIDRKIYVELNDEETKKLQNSIDIIKEAINNIKD